MKIKKISDFSSIETEYSHSFSDKHILQLENNLARLTSISVLGQGDKIVQIQAFYNHRWRGNQIGKPEEGSYERQTFHCQKGDIISELKTYFHPKGYLTSLKILTSEGIIGEIGSDIRP